MKYLPLLLLIGCAQVKVVEPGPTTECMTYYSARIGLEYAREMCK